MFRPVKSAMFSVPAFGKELTVDKRSLDLIPCVVQQVIQTCSYLPVSHVDSNVRLEQFLVKQNLKRKT